MDIEKIKRIVNSYHNHGDIFEDDINELEKLIEKLPLYSLCRITFDLNSSLDYKSTIINAIVILLNEYRNNMDETNCLVQHKEHQNSILIKIHNLIDGLMERNI